MLGFHGGKKRFSHTGNEDVVLSLCDMIKAWLALSMQQNTNFLLCRLRVTLLLLR